MPFRQNDWEISMEAVARGVVEQAIDDELKDRRLELSYNTFKRFENIRLLDSAESAMFGKIYSEALSYFVNYKMHTREPIQMHEMEEFETIIDRRVFEIQQKIRHLSGR